MSRISKSSRNAVVSPVECYLRFNGERGVLTYWNGQENVDLDSVKMVLIDTINSIQGWSDSNNGRIYSDYFKNTRDKEINVRCGKVTLLTGMYADIKNDIKEVGGKFTVNILCSVNVDGVWKNGCVSFDKSSLFAWTQFVDDNKGLDNLYDWYITISQGEKHKKGRVEYYLPSFEMEPLDEEMAEVADTLTREVFQPYVDQFSQVDSVEQEKVEA